jgi:dynein heavy chain
MSFVGEALDNDPERLQRLWIHEVLRVYHDRLVDEADRDWIAKQIRECVEEHFGSRFEKVRVTDLCPYLQMRDER